jgi:hypothetical protein
MRRRQIPKWNYFRCLAWGKTETAVRAATMRFFSTRIPQDSCSSFDQVITALMEAAKPFAAVLGCSVVWFQRRVSAILQNIA